ncbi:MAG TPA: chloride channel protein [Puia sp.]|uniref:chloride channel protein n=1 Tax=Puia sp. TaxID=2045100 RepID=UPI002C05B717|nr:chloride channel protein [Puia sp.]HVU94240.1 chloride channel protein [Puia sp.]
MGIYTRVRIAAKRAFESIRNEKVKQNILQAVPFWVASSLTGLIAVLYARLFALAERGTQYILHTRAWSLYIISPACFIAAWWVVKKWAPYSRGSGIPQVMAAIELATPRFNQKVAKLLNLRILFIKFVSSLTMALGGGVIGREGPMIQVAGCIFRKINEWLPAWWPKISKRNMIMTGAAAGLAAAFNTPLGGIVFAVEELTRTHISYFKTALFTAIIIAGLTAQGLLGPYLYLGYPDVGHLSSYIFLWIAVVALIAGLAGSGMSKLILGIFRWKQKFRYSWQHILYVSTCAVILVTLGLFVNARAMGSGKDLITSSLFTSAKYSSWYMPFLRTAGPIFCFTTGAAGGIFAPALGAGASIGSTLSGWLHLADTDTNMLILSGMVAFLTGVTRTPFTSAILVLEMTDRHNVIFHLMLAGMIASLISMLVDKHSLYDHLKYQYVHAVVHEHEDAGKELTVSVKE